MWPQKVELPAGWNPKQHQGGVRHPEVRGLRFSRRSHSFVNGDEFAVVRIAPLGAVQLAGGERPWQLRREVRLP